MESSYVVLIRKKTKLKLLKNRDDDLYFDNYKVFEAAK